MTGAAALALNGAAPAQSAEVTYVSMGTGATNGVYYPVGNAICRIVNKSGAAANLWCSAESTPGSIYNLSKLGEGELECAIVQSDTQHEAYNGRGTFAGTPKPWLRSIASLHPELMTIIARPGLAADGLEALKRKRLNAGPIGSGSHSTWSALEQGSGWKLYERAILSEMKADLALTALCADQLDAEIFLVGHPSAVVRKHLQACESEIVPVAGPMIDMLLSTLPYYKRGVIAAGAYGLKADVPTFGVRATLVTSAKLNDQVAYTVARNLIGNIDELRAAHPALASLDRAQMAREALTAPLHPGAERAYREAGLIG